MGGARSSVRRGLDPGFGVLNVLGFRTAVEAGLLMIDHPDGVVTILPSMEKLAVRPFLLFWLAWVALRLFRGDRRATGRSAASRRAAVGMARYVVLLAVYAEHDDILAGNRAGRAGSVRVAVDHGRVSGARRLRRGSCGGLPAWAARTRAELADWRGFLGRGDGGALRAGGVGLDVRSTRCGKGRPNLDRRPVLRHLGADGTAARYRVVRRFPDVQLHVARRVAGEVVFRSMPTRRGPYDDELLSGYDVLILKTPEEPIPDAEIAAIDRFVRRGGGLLLVGDHTNLLGMGTHLNALSARHGIRFRYDSVSDGLTGGFVELPRPPDRPPSSVPCTSITWSS